MQPTSTEHQFTPGPWTGFLHERAPGEAAWLIGPSSARPIVAAVEADEEAGLTGATVEGNARLIAAAPELLAALKDMTAHLRSFTLDPGEDEDDAPALIAAEALIARAEGRAS